MSDIKTQARAVEQRLCEGWTNGRLREAADTIAALLAALEAAERGLEIYTAKYNEVYDELQTAKADAALRYTAFQNPHNDDQWLEHPADSEIVDAYGDDLVVGFEYELVAGSYTTQRYRVTKIADEIDDDIEVELIDAAIAAGGTK